MDERNNWIAVACADHVARGRELGIMQVGHGKGAPLKRIRAGDRVAYYSPVQTLGEKQPCQAFTAIGTVRDELVYQADMSDMLEGFKPFRKNVDYDLHAHPAPIHPLLPQLSFTRDKARNWGYAFRFGLLKVTDDDMDAIAHAMGSAQDHKPVPSHPGLSTTAGHHLEPSHPIHHATR
jgi:hypothetical protein